jgi:hypothetical protein
MKKSEAGLAMVVGLMALVTWLAGTGVATATLPIQKKAKELGYPATNCQYCHVDKLPKKGASTGNERGAWLIAEKDKRKAKEVDAAWLKEYVEKKDDTKK